jgi:hypothetical protein
VEVRSHCQYSLGIDRIGDPAGHDRAIGLEASPDGSKAELIQTAET